ncbi:MAG TPA: POTRA domain-containing protein [Candidatus Acidoferrales bacterium]|nr:POTRA domain-containing protein [Candidatus Acidoferrales bacterium]
MRPRSFFLSACLCVFLLASLPANVPAAVTDTQASPQGSSKLAGVTFSGSAKLSNDQLLATSGLKIGDTVTKGDLQGAADRMSALGVFSNVNYTFKTGTAGVEVQFVVKEAPLFPVEYDNFPWFTDAELAEAIRQAVSFYDGTAPSEGQMVDLMVQAVQKLLPSRAVFGQVHADLVQRSDGSGSLLELSVAGSPVLLEKLLFTDAFATSSSDIAARMVDVIGKPYSRYATELFAYEQVRPAYLAAGHLKVAFGEPEASVAGGSQKTVTATLPITPGPVYKWAGAAWSGNTALSPTALNSLVPLTVGNAADGNSIQALWLAVSRAYSHIGYEDATVDDQPEFDDATGTVKYSVRITEGPQYHMGELVVTGLSIDAEKHLRQAWTMPAGAAFDETYFEEFYDKLIRPTAAVFDDLPVHYEKTGQLLRRNAQTHTIDVLLDFQ